MLTTVTWTASYATTTADTFGSLASPTVTQIATGTFTVSSTRTQYSANISIPSAATTGIQIVFSVGAQTSGTWVIDTVQLEVGSSATGFEYVDYGTQLLMCQRYYQTSFPLGTAPYNNTTSGTISPGNFAQVGGTGSTSGTAYARARGVLSPQTRTSPSLTFYQPNGSGATSSIFGDIVNGADATTYAAALGNSCSTYFDVTPNSGNGMLNSGNSFGVQWAASAEL